TISAGLSAREIRYRMDPSWLWHDFIRDLRSGGIDRVLAITERQCQRPITVAIGGGMAIDDWDFIRFEYLAGQLSLAATNGSGGLSALTSGRSVPQLAELIEKTVQAIEWVWIDFHVGLTFAPDGDEEWDANQIWTRVCAP